MTQQAGASGRTNIHLAFPPSVSGTPLVCNLTRLFDLDFSISTAQISPRQEGFMTMELSGTPEACARGIAYLRERGIRVSPVAQRIWHDEERCMQCGECTALCPSGALSIDPVSRRLDFNKEKCTVCARCIRICPVGAVQMDALDEDFPEE